MGLAHFHRVYVPTKSVRNTYSTTLSGRIASMPPGHRIFLRNLPDSATGSEIKALFATHHPLQAEPIPALPGCAVVGFRTKAEARQVVEDFEDLVFRGFEVDVKLYRKPKKQTGKGVEDYEYGCDGKAVEALQDEAQGAEEIMGLDGEGENVVEDYFGLKPGQPAFSRPEPASESKILHSTTPVCYNYTTATHDSPNLDISTTTDNSGSSLTQPLHRKLFGQRNRIGPPSIHGLTDLSDIDVSTPEPSFLPILKQDSPNLTVEAHALANYDFHFSAPTSSPGLGPLKMNNPREAFSNTKVEVTLHRNGGNASGLTKGSRTEAEADYDIGGLSAAMEGVRVSPEEKRPSGNYSGPLKHLLKNTLADTEDSVGGDVTAIAAETTLEDGSNDFTDDKSNPFDNADMESDPFHNWTPSGEQEHSEHINDHENNQGLQRVAQNTNFYSSPGPASPYDQQDLGLCSSPGLVDPHAQDLLTEGTMNLYTSPGPAHSHSTPDPQTPLDSHIRHTPFASQLRRSAPDTTTSLPPGYEVQTYTCSEPIPQRLTPEQLQRQRMKQQYLRGETPQPPPYVHGDMPDYPVEDGPANPLTWDQLVEQRGMEGRARGGRGAGFGEQHLREEGGNGGDGEHGTNWEIEMRPTQDARVFDMRTGRTRAQHVLCCELCRRMGRWHKCPKPTHLHFLWAS